MPNAASLWESVSGLCHLFPNSPFLHFGIGDLTVSSGFSKSIPVTLVGILERGSFYACPMPGSALKSEIKSKEWVF